MSKKLLMFYVISLLFGVQISVIYCDESASEDGTTEESTDKRVLESTNTAANEDEGGDEDGGDRVIGGKKIDISNFPFIVSIQTYERHHCGGSLFTLQWVLTAAHCIVQHSPGNPTESPEHYTVVAGTTNAMITEENIAFEQRRVFAVYAHPKYDPTPVWNDIGIMQLTSMFTLHHHNVQLMNRPPPNAFADLEPQFCTVIGWGSTTAYAVKREAVSRNRRNDVNDTLPGGDDVTLPSSDDDTLPGSDDVTLGSTDHGGSMARYDGDDDQPLYAVKVPVVEVHKCELLLKRVRSTTLLYDSVICAADLKGGKDGCQGDSGGPLVCNGYMMGLTSYGYGCGQPNLAGVFTRVDYYLTWIEDTIKQHSKDIRDRKLVSNEEFTDTSLATKIHDGYLYSILFYTACICFIVYTNII